MQMALIEFTIVGLIHCQTSSIRREKKGEGGRRISEILHPQLSVNMRTQMILCIAVTFATLVPFP